MEFADVVARAAMRLRTATQPSHIASAAISRAAVKLEAIASALKTIDASEARDTVRTAGTSGHRPQEANDLQQLEHQRQRIHPDRPRLLDQRRIDGGYQRRDGGATHSLRDFRRASPD